MSLLLQRFSATHKTGIAVSAGMFFIALSACHASSVSVDAAYEPFFMRQFNGEFLQTYQSGTPMGSEYVQGNIGLLAHLISVRIEVQSDPLYGNVSIGFVTGVSATPAPVVKNWSLPALADFTGTISVPYAQPSADYWKSHSISTWVDGVQRYLIEETSLAYVPAKLQAEKAFSVGRSLNITVLGETGFSFFYIELETRRLTGAGAASFYQAKRSMVHVAKTVGTGFKIDYLLSHRSSIFINFDVNGVSGISNLQVVQETSSSSVDGYRFDGLRYNAKLGVSWKI